MARPIKWRKIEYVPTSNHFTPNNRVGVLENILKLEEIEAIRLKDIEGLEQSECAKKMEVSRPTFQRILGEARKKIADSIVNGKAIRIVGGNFTRNICRAVCLSCGFVWKDSYEHFTDVNNKDYICPKCGSKDISCQERGQGNCLRGQCNRRGQNS